MLHPQLELMLEIQDLRAQRDGLSSEPVREVESDVFDVEIDEAISALENKAVELEERLDADVRRRYRTVAGSGARAVAPVLNGICYGCFMAVPTAAASEIERNTHLDVCEHCGRFLYYVD